ncbi:MAG TPA: hypothetical protein PKA41_12590 [Verrucomicrobiota bacterium]|nr:hypothetical protein [Verrucomicrobiota bacterium]
MNPTIRRGGSPGSSAFTLVETIMCLVVAGIIFGGAIAAYVQSARFTEWTGYSLAAQTMSLNQLEQVRAAKWDTESVPEVDEWPAGDTFEAGPLALDVPRSGTNVLYATNFITVTTNIPGLTAGMRLKLVRVDTVWAYRDELFTNTTVTYLAPDR